MQKYYIVDRTEDQGIVMHPMKAWLRGNPRHLPAGSDATLNTSRELRRALIKAGWSFQETATEVRFIIPGTEAVAASADEPFGSDSDNDSEDQEAAPSFRLEYQLRDFIAQNISSINFLGKRLKLFVDSIGRKGIEYPTSVGLIDLLAVDDTGAFYILELKRARTPDHVIGQLARYMG